MAENSVQLTANGTPGVKIGASIKFTVYSTRQSIWQARKFRACVQFIYGEVIGDGKKCDNSQEDLREICTHKKLYVGVLKTTIRQTPMNLTITH